MRQLKQTSKDDAAHWRSQCMNLSFHDATSSFVMLPWPFRQGTCCRHLWEAPEAAAAANGRRLRRRGSRRPADISSPPQPHRPAMVPTVPTASAGSAAPRRRCGLRSRPGGSRRQSGGSRHRGRRRGRRRGRPHRPGSLRHGAAIGARPRRRSCRGIGLRLKPLNGAPKHQRSWLFSRQRPRSCGHRIENWAWPTLGKS